jgi:hypothetical protein
MLLIGRDRVHVTIYRGAKAPEPIDQVDLPWAQLVVELDAALAETAPRKEALLAFGPYRLRPGASRADAHVVARTFVALDSDDGADPEGYVGRLIDLGLAGFVYTSPSDTPAKRKCRVVVPLAAELEPSAARVAMTALAEALGMAPGCGVERTLDASRLYFIGRVAGTPPRQSWTVDGDHLDAAALPAPVLAWSAAKATPAAGGGVDARAQAVAERLPPSVEGHGGDAALFVAARELATVIGPDSAAIRAALDVFNARCLPPWDARKLDREAARAAAAESTVAAKTLRRLRGESATECATPADAPEPEGGVFLITPKGRDVFAFDPRIEAYRECARESLVITLRTTGADALVTMTGPRGGTMAPQAILDANATAIVREAVTDFRSPAPCLFDRAGDRVLLGVVCPAVTPQRSDAVATWLEALAGDEVAAVQQWIASTRQDRIHRLATALCLIGAHSTGKTVFARVCARLWGAEPVELDNVVAQFNATMATCPVVLDDECKCLARRSVSTEDFRVLLQSTARMYEPKGKERRPLIGAQRFILTANDAADVRFKNALGHGAIDALAERITVVVIDDEQAALARAALDAVRLPGGELDWLQLVGHFAWLQSTVAIPGDAVRFLGQGADRARARRAVMAHAIEADQAVYDRIGEVAEGRAKPGAVFVAAGRLWIKPRAFADALALASGADRWDLARVQRALEPVLGPRRYVWVDGASVKAREIDTARMVEIAGLDAAVVAKTLA